MKTIGIVAHSAEGGALCFLTACREGQAQLGEHMHPTIVVSAIPMALSLGGWESGDHEAVGRHLSDGVRQVRQAGADFWLCPDNTAHIVLEELAPGLPIPGLHIAEVVAAEIRQGGWLRVGLLGTEWTMTGPVYPRILKQHEMSCLVPDEGRRRQLHAAIFDELCQGVFTPETRGEFLAAIDDLRHRGAECVILGCTEIPLIVEPSESSLPVLDSTRLLARYAVREAVAPGACEGTGGWLAPRAPSGAT